MISQEQAGAAADRRRARSASSSTGRTCWRTKRRVEQERQYLTIDPHSPPEFRANIVRNLDEFHEVFDTADGDGLWLDPGRARPDLVTRIAGSKYRAVTPIRPQAATRRAGS